MTNMAQSKTIALAHPAFGDVRVVRIDNDFWFVAKDICDLLEIVNNRDAVSYLDEDEKGVGKVYTPGGTQEMVIISESGLYTLLIRSNKPQARPFRRWVTKEVLPAIRKYGSYSTDPRKMDRIVRDADKKAAKQLFAEIDRSISQTDKNRVKKLAGVDNWYVNEVLRCEKEDPALAAMLFGRAVGSTQMRGMFYEIDGVGELTQMLNELRAKKADKMERA